MSNRAKIYNKNIAYDDNIPDDKKFYTCVYLSKRTFRMIEDLEIKLKLKNKTLVLTKALQALYDNTEEEE